MSRTFTVNGHKIRTASQRRFAVVRVTTDKWAVMDEIEYTYTGSRSMFTRHEVAKDERGFRMIFDSNYEAMRAMKPGQVVKVWSKDGAEIIKRSDSFETARKQAARSGFTCVIIDTTTGEEV